MPNPVLKVGGPAPVDAVRRLQYLLQLNGHLASPVIVDTYTRDLANAVAYFQQTHQGPGGKPLVVDAVVGDGTWWALENASGDAQRSFIVGKIPDGLSDKRRRVLDVALSQHGVKEEPNGTNRGPGVDKYLPGFVLQQKGQGPAWCCFFFSWVSREAFGGSYPMGKRYGSCVEVSKAAESAGFWFPNNGRYVPRPGDAFVMLYEGDRAGHGHIGYVLRVDPVTGRFNTCEGNCGNRVKVGLRDYDADARIAGFINFYGDAGVAPSYEVGVIDAQNVGAEATV